MSVKINHIKHHPTHATSNFLKWFLSFWW